MANFNCTHLDPEKTFERHVYHRDQFAHYLRWTHVLKKLKRNMNVLDWGTFASIKDYKDKMNEHEQYMYNKLYEYFDVNILSNLMAPLFPEQSRNVLWKLLKIRRIK